MPSVGRTFLTDGFFSHPDHHISRGFPCGVTFFLSHFEMTLSQSDHTKNFPLLTERAKHGIFSPIETGRQFAWFVISYFKIGGGGRRCLPPESLKTAIE